MAVLRARSAWLPATTLTGARPVRLRGVLLAALGVVLLARAPADWRAPQFNAEEGAIFFQQAYNDGFLSSLFSSESGYYHLALRLTAGLALLAPLELAPLVFKIVAFAIQMLPVAYLLADGVAGFVSAPLWRVAAAVLYVAGPNADEVYLNVNNSQWHLTLAACLILLSAPPRGVRRALDAGVLTLFAFSGPYSTICAPLALWNLCRADARGPDRMKRLGPLIVLAGGAVQAAYLFTGSRLGSGLDGFPGLTVPEVVRIVSIHGALNSFFGIAFVTRHLKEFPSWAFVVAATSLLLVPVIAVRLRNGPLLVLSGLASVSVTTMFLFPLNDPRLWLQPHVGPRYYIFATFAILCTLLVMLERGGWWRWSAMPLLAVALAFGTRGDFRLPPTPDTHWTDQVAAFRSLPDRTPFFMPVHPQPSAWGMTLVKRGASTGSGLLDPYARTDLRLVAVVSLQHRGPSDGEPMIILTGLAVDFEANAPAGAVFLVMDGRVWPAVTGIEAPFMMQHLSDPNLVKAGFYRMIPERELGPGAHRVEVWVLDSTRSRLLEPGPLLEFSLPLPEGRE